MGFKSDNGKVGLASHMYSSVGSRRMNQKSRSVKRLEPEGSLVSTVEDGRGLDWNTGTGTGREEHLEVVPLSLLLSASFFDSSVP